MKRWFGLFCLLSWLATPILWWLSVRTVPREIALPDVGRVFWTKFSDDGRLFLGGDEDEIHVYDVLEGKHLNILPRSMRDMWTSNVPGTGVFGFRSGQAVEFVDVTTGETTITFSPGSGLPDNIYLAPNGTLAATYHSKEGLSLWDLNTGQRLMEIVSTPGSVSFSPDSKRIAVMDRSANHLKIVDVSTRRVTVWPNSENRGILNLWFTPDDRLVALAFGTDEELLLDLTADKVLVRCQSASSGFLGRGAYCHIGHRPFSSVVSLAKSIGADRIAEWALNAKPRRQVYDTSTGRIVGWTPYVESQVLPDGKTIAIYSYDDGCVELWDMPPRTVIHPLLCWAALVCAVALTAWWWHMRRKARRTGALQTATSRAAEGASSTLV